MYKRQGLSFGIGPAGGNHVIAAHNGNVGIGHTYGLDSNSLPQYYETLTVAHVDQAVGKVGIGTSNPGSKLEVKSSGSTTNEIALVHSGNTVKIASLAQESSHGSLHLRANNGTDKVRLSAGGNSSYILDSSVGIGTTGPVSYTHLTLPTKRIV